MKIDLPETQNRLLVPALLLALTFFLFTAPVQAQSDRGPAVLASSAVETRPPAGGEFFPLSEVRRGMMATAWTVFTGTEPEPMSVEILGVLRGARGPGHDMILAQLHGAKPEYTGVVAGMSGSPVYIGNRLLGSLSFRIGQFSKDPIAGITPIREMLEVRDLPLASGTAQGGLAASFPATGSNFQAMETPLVMSGFRPEAIRLWQQKMAGSSLETVTAGGGGSGGASTPAQAASARASLVPGSAVSAQLVRGDLEIAATCTVTYVDPRQLLACGHPILQAGPVSLPMTTAEVLASLASPLNAFKIINTGTTIGAFTEDRDAAIRGEFGAIARMIPMRISVHSPTADRSLKLEVVDLPSITPQAVLVSLYNALLESNESTDATSYHLTGSMVLDGYPPARLDLWASATDSGSAPMDLAALAGERFARLYSNGSRTGLVRSIDLHIDAIPRRVQVEIDSARLVGGNIVHAGDSVDVEATIRPWHQPSHNLRLRVLLPSRLEAGNLRLLVSDSGTLDRTLDQPRNSTRPVDLATVLAQTSHLHAADRLYVSLMAPETQANMNGQTLTSLPLSVANALEPLRTAQDVNLNGESVILLGEEPVGGVLNGFQILNLRIEAGGGLN